MDMLHIANVPVEARLDFQMGRHEFTVRLAFQLFLDLVHALLGNHIVHDDDIDDAWLWVLVPLRPTRPQAVSQPLCVLQARHNNIILGLYGPALMHAWGGPLAGGGGGGGGGRRVILTFAAEAGQRSQRELTAIC